MAGEVIRNYEYANDISALTDGALLSRRPLTFSATPATAYTDGGNIPLELTNNVADVIYAFSDGRVNEEVNKIRAITSGKIWIPVPNAQAVAGSRGLRIRSATNGTAEVNVAGTGRVLEFSKTISVNGATAGPAVLVDLDAQ